VSKSNDVVQGTVDLLILRTLAAGPKHGWAVAARIRQVSNEVLQLGQGALYPALHRLEHAGWIKAEWGESENKRKAKYYSLTRAGKKYLAHEQASWERLSAAIGLILRDA
jgi:PadR family transcriptional regulator PadR